MRRCPPHASCKRDVAVHRAMDALGVAAVQRVVEHRDVGTGTEVDARLAGGLQHVATPTAPGSPSTSGSASR